MIKFNYQIAKEKGSATSYCFLISKNNVLFQYNKNECSTRSQKKGQSTRKYATLSEPIYEHNKQSNWESD